MSTHRRGPVVTWGLDNGTARELIKQAKEEYQYDHIDQFMEDYEARDGWM